MKKPLLLFVFLILFCSLPARADLLHRRALVNSVNIWDFGAIANDNLDDSAAMQAASDALLYVPGGGGTLNFDDGEYDQFGNVVNFITGAVSGNIRLQGTGKTIIKVHNGSQRVGFNFGNLNRIEIDGITFIGENVYTKASPDFIDSLVVISASESARLTITNSDFAGLAVPDGRGVIETKNVELVLSNDEFGGCYSGLSSGVLFLKDSRGVSVDNSSFKDYLQLNGATYSKTPEDVGDWIKAFSPLSFQSQIYVHRSFFDEGARRALDVSGFNNVEFSGNKVNVSTAGGGVGVALDNVKNALVSQNWLGFSRGNQNGVSITNNTTCELKGNVFAGTVNGVVRDSTSKYFVPQGIDFNIRTQ